MSETTEHCSTLFMFSVQSEFKWPKQHLHISNPHALLIENEDIPAQIQSLKPSKCGGIVHIVLEGEAFKQVLGVLPLYEHQYHIFSCSFASYHSSSKERQMRDI